MLPTIEPGDSPLGLLPDHGDAWRTAWRATSTGLQFISTFGYTIVREARTRELGIDLQYTLSTAVESLPVLWAAHPLFRAELETHVEMDGYNGLVLDKRTDRWIPWSDAVTSVSRLPEGGAIKYVLPADATVHDVSIIHPNGDMVRMTWNPVDVPYLALYIERRAHSLEPAIAVEPMTGWYDGLGRALANERVQYVRADTPKAWMLHLDFSR